MLHYTRLLLVPLLLVILLLVPVHPGLAAEPLILSVHPYQSATKLLQAYTPLAEYLRGELGIPVQIQIAPDYAVHVQRIGENEVDLAYMGPASYVELVDKYGKKPIIARQYINGIPTFQGKFITRKDSAIHSIADLNGKRFAFGDKGSTMSHLVPQYMLIEANVQLKTAKFLGSHDNVALGVLTGDYDAGAVKEAIFYKYAARGLKAIATTPAQAADGAKSIPGPPWVVKAQIHAGGRGKGGGVRLVKTVEELREAAQDILSHPLVTPQTGPSGQSVRQVLVEEGLDIEKEFYLGIVVDRKLEHGAASNETGRSDLAPGDATLLVTQGTKQMLQIVVGSR